MDAGFQDEGAVDGGGCDREGWREKEGMFPVRRNSMSKGLAGLAGNVLGRQNTWNPSTQKSSLSGKSLFIRLGLS